MAVLKQAGKNNVKLTDDRDVKDLGMKHSAIKGFFGEERLGLGSSGMSQRPVIGARLMRHSDVRDRLDRAITN